MNAGARRDLRRAVSRTGWEALDLNLWRNAASPERGREEIFCMTCNKIILDVAMCLCVGLPALAEIDLSGSWTSKNHEDAMERGAGPNPDDWAGLPFNESGRAKALSFSQSIISMPERICWFQTQWHIAAGPFSLKIWSANRSSDGQDHRVGDRRMGNSRAHDHLDGRASASLEKRSARSDRLYHRHLEWRRADRLHHAHEDRIYSPQWRAEQRRSHDYHHVSCVTEIC